MTIDVAQENLEKRAISRSAFKVMLGGIFSILAGFINQMIIAAYFGAGAEMDAYLTALVIPAYLQAVLLTGLSFVFIPTFIREETKGNEDAAWELVGTFFWITAGILITIAIIGSIFAREIISLTAPGFGAEKSVLAARMLSILMFSVPVAGLSTFTVGIQNARNSYFWPSFGGALNSIGSIVTVVLLSPWLGAIALAWGFFVATILQACVTIIPVVRHGWPRLIGLTDKRITEMAKLILPFIIFGLLTRGTTVFERYFASVLPSGQISYLGYAAKMSNIYMTLLVRGITAAIFPLMARAYVQGGKEGLTAKTTYGLRLALAIALPAVLITGAVSIPLVKVLFERGAFQPEDTYSVARVVLVTMLGDILCVMLASVIARVFYVLKDTLTSPLSSTISVVIYLGIAKFFTVQWGYEGLAYASLIQHAVFVLILSFWLVRRLPALLPQRILRSAFTYTLAALSAFLVGTVSSTSLDFLPALFNLLISGLASGVMYLAVLYFRDHEILIAVVEMLGIRRIIDLVKKARSYFGHIRLSY